MDIYMTKETRKNLEAIYKNAMNKWMKGLVETEPTRAEIVRSLIDGLHEEMVKGGLL